MHTNHLRPESSALSGRYLRLARSESEIPGTSRLPTRRHSGSTYRHHHQSTDLSIQYSIIDLLVTVDFSLTLTFWALLRK